VLDGHAHEISRRVQIDIDIVTDFPGLIDLIIREFDVGETVLKLSC